MRATDIAPEFLIAPPSWGLENPEGFGVGSRARALHLPLVEVRRRLSAALRDRASFFVEYRWVEDDDAFGVKTSQRVSSLMKLRVKHGKIISTVKGRDAVLGVPLPWFRALIHRFRAFDPDSSPCRH
jgi:hypothetical protein